MSNSDTAVIVLAAGLGTRMNSARPKVMHALGGRPLINHVMAIVDALAPTRTVVVIGPEMAEVANAVAPVQTAVQDDRIGTGDAVKAARATIEGFDGTVLTVFGDTPLLSAATLGRMLAAASGSADIVVLGFHSPQPDAYGRLVVSAEGALDRIVEAKDAGPEELALDLCNSGVMAVDGRHLFGLLDRLGNDNAKGEFYLTDIVALAREDGLVCEIVEGEEQELLGINTRADLAEAEAIVQGQWRERALLGGVTLIDPETVWFSFDTKIGADTVIEPHVFFGPGVAVGDGARIKSFSHIEGAVIGNGAQVGPFARLRSGTKLGRDAHIGNFVETKNAVIGDGAKAGHLTYLGDAKIGDQTNIGAGTITCNYDGVAKHQTVIGSEVFIGSNTILVAPVNVGDGAFVAAASAITENIEAGSLAVGRARQVTKPERGRQLKEKLRQSKK